MNAPLQDVSALPIDAIDVSDATLYQQDSWRPPAVLLVQRGIADIDRVDREGADILQWCVHRAFFSL